MQGHQQLSQLKLKFIELDTDGDGFITKYQLQSFMKKQKLFKKVPDWKINQAVILNQNQINQQNFVIWIMGCRIGLQELAFTKFYLSNAINKFQSPSPPAGPSKTKKSSINFDINSPAQSKQAPTGHFLNIQVGIDKQSYLKGKKQVQKILGHAPAQIYMIVKLRTDSDKGQYIAKKFGQIMQVGVAMLSELGPTATPILQCLQVTCKFYEENVYIALQLKNNFLNTLLNYIHQAIDQLSPQCKILLQFKVLSDFSQIIKQNFDPLNQSINVGANFQIDGTSLSKLKQKLVQEFDQKQSQNKFGMMLLFLLQQIDLSSSFQNLKQCFQFFGFKQTSIPKPAQYSSEIKKFQVKQIFGQFMPDGSELIDSISKNCYPEGQIAFHAKNMEVKLKFKLNIEGAFDLL